MLKKFQKWWNKLGTPKQEGFTESRGSYIPSASQVMPPRPHDCEKDGHKWSTWKVKVNEIYGYDTWICVQERTCQHCNKIDISVKKYRS
jgi:hypothetical protein